MDSKKRVTLALTLTFGLAGGVVSAPMAAATQAVPAKLAAPSNATITHKSNEHTVECNEHECCIYQNGEFITCI